jgi:hypothetical protein
LTYEVRGKLGLGHRQGICLDVEGDTLLVHVASKEKEPTRLPSTTTPTDLVPAAYSPATRLLHAADLDGVKVSWDREAIRRRAAELCGDIRVLRRVADEALDLGWDHIVDWVPLTESEKAWRAAHFASSTVDEDRLLASMTRLPDSGYLTRGELLLPHLGLIRHHADAWRPVLVALINVGVPNAREIMSAALGSWDASLDGGRVFLPEGGRTQWLAAREQLATGTIRTPPASHDVPSWQAAYLIGSVDRSSSVDSELDDLVGLEPALLDDLIDERRLTSGAALASIRGPLRTYLLARLDAAKLSDAEARAAGHTGELARRLYLSRDRATLSGLDDSPRVGHYQALLDVIEGGRPDPRRLDEQTVKVLEVPTAVLAQITDGASGQLTPEVVADPSLWPMFTNLAINGKLLPDPSRPADHPLNIWIGLQRLLGLIWEGNLAGAVEHGQLLAKHIESFEEHQDEALNLTAYALFQLGRVDEALDMLERALQGVYTENLLVNASIVASHARPEVGVRYLARLVDEAPTPDLRRAALDQAIGVWQRTDLDFPSVLVPALRIVLGSALPVDEYLRLGKVAVNVAADIIPTLPNPGGELDGPYRLLQIRARWKRDDDMGFAELATAYVALYRSVGRPEWFNDDWKGWVAYVRESIFVDFGTVPGIAQFVDTVHLGAPELFTPEERLVLLPQAGAHMAFAFRKNNSWLTDQAISKFFVRPIDEFLTIRNTMESGFADYLADNIARCSILGVLNRYEIRRPQMADEYNTLNARARWDQENRYAIHSQQSRLLREALADEIAPIELVLERVRRLSGLETKTRSLLDETASGVADWRAECDRLLRNL